MRLVNDPVLSVAMEDELIARARRSMPLEICAIGLGAEGRVAELVHLRNIAARPEREFRMDPVELAAALQRGLQHGRELVLIAHSHPSGHPRLSAADNPLISAWPGVIHAIITPDGQPPVQLHWPTSEEG